MGLSREAKGKAFPCGWAAERRRADLVGLVAVSPSAAESHAFQRSSSFSLFNGDQRVIFVQETKITQVSLHLKSNCGSRSHSWRTWMLLS